MTNSPKALRSILIRVISVLAAVSGLSANAALIGIGAEITDGPTSLGFQEFLPSTSPRAFNGQNTIRQFQQNFSPAGPWITTLTLTRDATDSGAETIGIEHFVFNNSGVDWNDVELTLGFGETLANFAAHAELNFLSSPAPINRAAIFTNSPIWDNPPIDLSANGFNQLLWSTGGSLQTGLDSSWAFVTSIGDSLFSIDPNNSAVETARISLRMAFNTTASAIPEPAPLAMIISGLLFGLATKRNNRQ